jgi:DNA invertase Pin-like site-specific DNA recombinase
MVMSEWWHLSWESADDPKVYRLCAGLDHRQDARLAAHALKAAGCKRIFIDKSVSNTHAKRPGLRKALAVLKPGDTLIVWKLDRFGRSLVHLVQAVAELQARGVNFRSLSDPIDMTIAAGRQALAALVEFERNAPALSATVLAGSA